MQKLYVHHCFSSHMRWCYIGFSFLKRSDGVGVEGMRMFLNLVNFVNFDLERCLKIHGGLVHVKGTCHTYEDHLFSYTAG